MREQARREVTNDYRARLIDGQILKLPLRNMKMEFDPGDLVPLDSSGTVYPHIRIVDDWGILHVTNHGALLKTDFSEVALSQPSSVTPRSIAGDGWTLELKPGWSVVPGERKGDVRLRSAAPP